MTPVEKFVEGIALVLGSYVNQIAADMADLGVSPGRVIQVAPGTLVPHDECCDGQLWARLVNFTPAVDPRPGLGCRVHVFSALVEIGTVRCVSTIENQGEAPSAEAMNLDGLNALNDMATVLNVIQCHPRTRSIERWVPSTISGGCGGGTWTFSVSFDNCLTCDGS